MHAGTPMQAGTFMQGSIASEHKLEMHNRERRTRQPAAAATADVHPTPFPSH